MAKLADALDLGWGSRLLQFPEFRTIHAVKPFLAVARTRSNPPVLGRSGCGTTAIPQRIKNPPAANHRGTGWDWLGAATRLSGRACLSAGGRARNFARRVAGSLPVGLHDQLVEMHAGHS